MNPKLTKLIDLMNKRGISGNQLQKDLKLSNSAFTLWKKRDSFPDKKLPELASYFGVPINYFYESGSEIEKAPATKGEGLDKYIQLLNKAGITEEKLSKLTIDDLNLIITYAKGIIDSKRNDK